VKSPTVWLMLVYLAAVQVLIDQAFAGGGK
jgi:hypothetical protein